MPRTTQGLGAAHGTQKRSGPATVKRTKSGVRVPQVAVAPAARSLPEGRYYEALRLLDTRAQQLNPQAQVPGWHSSTEIWRVIVGELEDRAWSRSTVTQRLGQLRDQGRIACEAVIVPDAVRGQQGLRYRLFADGETSEQAERHYAASIAAVREEQQELRRTARARAYTPPPGFKRLTINLPREDYDEAMRLLPRRQGVQKIGHYVAEAVRAYNELTEIECPPVLPQTRLLMQRLGAPERLAVEHPAPRAAQAG